MTHETPGAPNDDTPRTFSKRSAAALAKTVDTLDKALVRGQPLPNRQALTSAAGASQLDGPRHEISRGLVVVGHASAAVLKAVASRAPDFVRLQARSAETRKLAEVLLTPSIQRSLASGGSWAKAAGGGHRLMTTRGGKLEGHAAVRFLEGTASHGGKLSALAAGLDAVGFVAAMVAQEQLIAEVRRELREIKSTVNWLAHNQLAQHKATMQRAVATIQAHAGLLSHAQPLKHEDLVALQSAEESLAHLLETLTPEIRRRKSLLDAVARVRSPGDQGLMRAAAEFLAEAERWAAEAVIFGAGYRAWEDCIVLVDVVETELDPGRSRTEWRTTARPFDEFEQTYGLVMDILQRHGLDNFVLERAGLRLHEVTPFHPGIRRRKQLKEHLEQVRRHAAAIPTEVAGPALEVWQRDDAIELRIPELRHEEADE